MLHPTSAVGHLELRDVSGNWSRTGDRWVVLETDGHCGEQCHARFSPSFQLRGRGIDPFAEPPSVNTDGLSSSGASLLHGARRSAHDEQEGKATARMPD